MNIQNNTGLVQAKELLKQGNPETARKVLEDSLSRDLQTKTINDFLCRMVLQELQAPLYVSF